MRYLMRTQQKNIKLRSQFELPEYHDSVKIHFKNKPAVFKLDRKSCRKFKLGMIIPKILLYYWDGRG